MSSTVADAIRSARLRAGLTQKQLAGRAGLEHTAISRYERGLKIPPAALARLANTLHLSITVAAEEPTPPAVETQQLCLVD